MWKNVQAVLANPTLLFLISSPFFQILQACEEEELRLLEAGALPR